MDYDERFEAALTRVRAGRSAPTTLEDLKRQYTLAIRLLKYEDYGFDTSLIDFTKED